MKWNDCLLGVTYRSRMIVYDDTQKWNDCLLGVTYDCLLGVE